MHTETILYIFISGIIALFIALFQYKYKLKQFTKTDITLTILRFVTVFSLLLLLINPKFESDSVYLEKPSLVVAVDNSSSVSYLKQGQHALDFLEELKAHKEINKKFNIQTYTFGKQVKLSDSFSFTENQTHLDQMFREFSQIYKQTVSPTILDRKSV